MTQTDEVVYEWCGAFENTEVGVLHATGFDYAPDDHDWRGQLERHSLGWVCARRQDGHLVGFVNLVWEGGTHAFVLDTVVAVSERRHAVGIKLVAEAERRARAAGCDWLHVDFEEHLQPFYFSACGFKPTNAGLINLRA
jgi:GNAT superfamily N-acetyltransferase